MHYPDKAEHRLHLVTFYTAMTFRYERAHTHTHCYAFQRQSMSMVLQAMKEGYFQ